MAARALFVGGTNGVGYALACRMAAEMAPATVVISGRTKPAELPHKNMDFRRVDASSMREIKAFTSAFKNTQNGQKLDLLVMSQGIMTMNPRIETPEGIDVKMAIHYYGKQLIVRELMPILSDDAQVIVVYDSLFGGPKKLIWDDLDLQKQGNYGLKKVADHCTSMTDAMVQYFAKKQDNTKRQFIHAWPGGVRTNLLRDMPWYVTWPAAALQNLVTVTPDKYADNFLKGLPESVDADKKDGRLWSYVNNKGRPISNKASWTDEELDKVADHTFSLIDQALETKD